MRVEIKTNGPVKDNCLRAMYLIQFALHLCEERMVVPALEFFASKYGYKLIKK